MQAVALVVGASLPQPCRKIPNREFVPLCVKVGKLYARLIRGQLANVRIADFCRLLETLGFEQIRSSGSHIIFGHPGIPEQVNLQDVRGQAKPYQIRQVLRLVERYNLNLEEKH